MEAQARQRKTVSITIPPKLWTGFRIECLRRDITASEVAERLIRQQMDIWEKIAERDTLES